MGYFVEEQAGYWKELETFDCEKSSRVNTLKRRAVERTAERPHVKLEFSTEEMLQSAAERADRKGSRGVGLC